MMLECHDKKYPPLFTTWTFKPEEYSGSEKQCKADIQRFWKKLRYHGHDIRYFTVIERGSQKHRLHGHSILWSESLSNMPLANIHRTLHDIWQKGIVDISPVRSAAGLNYVTKYLVKDLSEEKQRNYQWSQKPMLGDAGRRYWEEAIHHYHIQEPFTINRLPPNHMLIPVIGELKQVYIPKSYYVQFCKVLGIDFSPEEYKTPETWDPLVKDYESQPHIQLQAEKYIQESAGLLRKTQADDQ